MTVLSSRLLGVAQSRCADCARGRVIANELVVVEYTSNRVAQRQRVTVLEGCATCEGSTAII